MTKLIQALVLFTSFACTRGGSDVKSDSNDSSSAIKLSLNSPAQKFDGWGAGLSWWAKASGQTEYAELYAELFFTDKTVNVLGRDLPGLNINIARYNIGGGANGIAGENVSSKLEWWKGVDGFHVLPGSADDVSTENWNWNNDPHQRHIMALAKERNVNTFEFVSHAPMWWMNDSNSSQGGNLKLDSHEAHANHLAQTIAYAKDNWGITAASVEAFNEPVSTWWTFPKNQEGVVIPRSQQADVLKKLRTKLDERGVPDTKIAASDENTVDQAIDTYRYLEEQNVTNLVDKVNVHAYNGIDPYRNNVKRQELRSLVPETKKIWMTEYGDGDGSGLVMAQTITEDLKYLKANAWFYWQPLEPFTGWGMLNGDYSDRVSAGDNLAAPYKIHNKFFAFAHYSRFITEGCQFYEVSSESSVLAYCEADKKLVMVTFNTGESRDLVLDVSDLGVLGSVELTSSDLDDNDKLFVDGVVTIEGSELKFTAGERSIHTLVIGF